MSNSSEEQGSQRGAVPKKPGAARPSLLGAPAAERPPEEASVSILSAVSADPKAKRAGTGTAAPPLLSRGLLVLGLLVVVGILLLALRGGEGVTAATAIADAKQATPAAQTASGPASSESIAQATSAAEHDRETPVTATIETVPSVVETPTAISAGEVGSVTTVPKNTDATLAAALASAAPAAAVSSATSSKAEPAKRAADNAAAAKGVRGSRASSTATARDKARKSEDRLLSALNQSTTSGKASEQRDIELIQALLAHAGAAPAVKGSSAKTTPAPRALPAGPKIALNSQTPRDVAERKPGASTTELIRKCEDFGVLEGLLCRIRICSDRWGKDAACPAQAAPPGVQP